MIDAMAQEARRSDTIGCDGVEAHSKPEQPATQKKKGPRHKQTGQRYAKTTHERANIQYLEEFLLSPLNTS